MSGVFDPYHRWLGIPPRDQPPNYYRLLGLDRFESDPGVIATAADRQMAHLRGYQIGEHADLSQQILNELAAVRVCLLDPDRKTRYDAALASGRSPAPESGPMVQDDTLELTEQPADDPPFSAKILDAGEPTSEEWDARIEALAGLHRSLSGDEPPETPEQAEPAKIDETESTDAPADLAGDESQPEVESGVASRPSMPGPTRIEEVRGAVVPDDGTGQGETGAAFDRLTIWTTALTFLAALCVVGIAAWVLQRSM